MNGFDNFVKWAVGGSNLILAWIFSFSQQLIATDIDYSILFLGQFSLKNGQIYVAKLIILIDELEKGHQIPFK